MIRKPALFAALGLALAGTVAAPALSPAPAAAQSARDAQAEAFVQTEGQRALSILADQDRSTADKIRAFRGFVDQVADVPRITNFVLGKYARTISPAQRQEFATVFREYAQNVYESRLGDYHGETLKVTGSIVRKPGDVIVNSMVTGGARKEPVAAAWRVIDGGRGWRIVDVQVQGVWLAITQQQDFVSTIDNAGGDIQVLIDQLRPQLAQGRGRGR